LAGKNGPVTPGTARTGKPVKAERRITIPFEDNRLAAKLFGEYDANLALVEARLGVVIVAHGNLVTVTGTHEACEMTREVLNHLYERARTGEVVRQADVEGAIRHTQRRSSPADGEEETPKGAGQIRTRMKQIFAQTKAQSAYISALERKDLVFGSGPAGTGKTYLAVAYAAQCWERGVVERIILSRPAVEAGERLGFLPGDMRDKVDPYLRPLYDALYDVLPRDKVERALADQIIEIAPLAFMRGRTLAHAFVILDEAQNCTSMQMKMFLTRLGEGSHMVVTGDPTQTDLPKGTISGLPEAIGLLRGLEEVSVVEFTQKDVVRRKLVADIVAAYEGAT
jgi:phosphate starvation-inducible protein PhoH and related proteins